MIKKISALSLVLFVVTHSQLMTSRFTTSFYGLQGRDSARSETMYARVFEQVQFSLANEQYQFATNFQVANDFGTAIATDPELRISSLMVKGKNIGGLADISVGRQFVYAGVGAGIIDGAIITGNYLGNTLGMTLYSGLNVIRTRDWNLNQSLSENSLSGALLTYTPIENGTIGLSYMNKLWKRDKFSGMRPNAVDSTLDPRYVLFYTNPNEEEYVSADLMYELHSKVHFYVRSDYDVLLEELSRTEFSMKYFVTHDLSVSADYLFREPRVAFNSIFSVFNYSSTKEIEGALEYQLMPKAKLYARFANVDYEDETSGRLSVGGVYEFLNFNYTQNFGYAGELNGVNVFAAYPLTEYSLTPSAGFGFASYKLSKDGPENSVINFVAGTNYRISNKFTADVQIQWMKNPQYDSDVRVFMKASYFLFDRLNIF